MVKTLVALIRDFLRTENKVSIVIRASILKRCKARFHINKNTALSCWKEVNASLFSSALQQNNILKRGNIPKLHQQVTS